MQSHRDVRRIQLTEETKALIGDAYRFGLRGTVEIKGKGSLLIYWLICKAGRVDQDARVSISRRACCGVIPVQPWKAR